MAVLASLSYAAPHWSGGYCKRLQPSQLHKTLVPERDGASGWFVGNKINMGKKDPSLSC